MLSSQNISFRLYEGANLIVPFPAVIAELDDPFDDAFPSHKVHRLLGELYPKFPLKPTELTNGSMNFPTFAATLVKALQEHLWQNALPPPVTMSDAGKWWIAVRFFRQDLARDTLEAGIHVAGVVFSRASGASSDAQVQSPTLQRVLTRDYGRVPSATTATLRRLSNARNIPVYSVCEASRIHMFGQGARGFHFSEIANSKDSITGFSLARRKDFTSIFLQRLGFPSVHHQVTANAAAAHQIANEIGFPLVVKPVDGAKGVAVSVAIQTGEELDVAFAEAHAASRRGLVLVERYVPGDGHRLTVCNGKLIAASRLIPPRIFGDGTRTVSELIEDENRKRIEDPNTGLFFPRLTVDAKMTAFLRRQGFALSDRPQKGVELQLRGTSNLHAGGTREDVTVLVHPDNIAMAETIAKCFHLDAIGIDFITPDIRTAWHQIPCAIIEVNSNPGIGPEAILEKILLETFPPGCDGRIPSILIVGNSDVATRITRAIQASGKKVGKTSGLDTELAGQRRFISGEELPERVLGLLLDATCEALVVSCTLEDIAKYGLPHTRYDIAMLYGSNDLPKGMRQLIEQNTLNCVRYGSSELTDNELFGLIATL